MKVGNRQSYAKITSVQEAKEYKMWMDVNWTYPGFVMQDKSHSQHPLFISSDDCCDYGRITIKENMDGEVIFASSFAPAAVLSKRRAVVLPAHGSRGCTNSYSCRILEDQIRLVLILLRNDGSIVHKHIVRHFWCIHQIDPGTII